MTPRNELIELIRKNTHAILYNVKITSDNSGMHDRQDFYWDEKDRVVNSVVIDHKYVGYLPGLTLNLTGDGEIVVMQPGRQSGAHADIDQITRVTKISDNEWKISILHAGTGCGPIEIREMIRLRFIPAPRNRRPKVTDL